MKIPKLTAEFVRDRLIELIRLGVEEVNKTRQADGSFGVDAFDEQVIKFAPGVYPYVSVGQTYRNKMLIRFDYADLFWPGAEIVVTVGKPDASNG